MHLHGLDNHAYKHDAYDHHGYDHHVYDHHGYDYHGYDHHSCDHHAYDHHGYYHHNCYPKFNYTYRSSYHYCYSVYAHHSSKALRSGAFVQGRLHRVPSTLLEVDDK